MTEKKHARTAEEKLSAAQERLRKAEQTRAKERRKVARLKRETGERERKRDTRRKLLVGAAVLKMVDKEEELGRQDWPRWLSGLMEEELVRADDRELFGLRPVPEPAAAPVKPAVQPKPVPQSGPDGTLDLWSQMQR